MTIENKLHRILATAKQDTTKTGIQAALNSLQSDTDTTLTEEQKHGIIRERIQHHRHRVGQLILSGDITAAEQENTIAMELSDALPQGPCREELREMVKNAIRDENLTSSPESIDVLVDKYSLLFNVSPRNLRIVAETVFAERAAHAAKVALADFLDRYSVPSESVFDHTPAYPVSSAMSKHLAQAVLLLDAEIPTVEKIVIQPECDDLLAYTRTELLSAAGDADNKNALGTKIFVFNVPQELGSRRFTTDNVTNKHLAELLNDSAQELTDLGVIQNLLAARGAINLDYQKLREIREQLEAQVGTRWADVLKSNL